jgi:hypothetical protein
MKTKLALFAVVCLMVVQQVSAQDYAFKVLVNKGKNEVKAGSAWQSVKVGASLKATDELKVSENSYVGLVHKSGKPLELKQAGKYKISDLAGKVSSNNSSVLNKYADFILSSDEQKGNNMQATGAVHRGPSVYTINIPSAKQNPIVYADKALISWDNTNFPPPYKVELRSMFGDVLAKYDVTKNEILIDFSDASFANEDNITLQVFGPDKKATSNEDYALKRVSKADKTRIKNALQEFAPQVSEETALNKLYLAGFYEKNNLLIDAGTQYQEAIKLAPDVAFYKEEYQKFLLRTQIKTLPEKK